MARRIHTNIHSRQTQQFSLITAPSTHAHHTITLPPYKTTPTHNKGIHTHVFRHKWSAYPQSSGGSAAAKRPTTTNDSSTATSTKTVATDKKPMKSEYASY